VTGSAKSKNDVPLASSIPEGAASLDSILCTEELQRRPSRPPDHAKENAALVALVNALAESRHTILEILAETILRVTDSDSSGLSLLTSDGATPDDEGQRFYWPAIKGMWKEHVGAGHRAISVPAETYLIVIVLCCFGTSSDVTPICCLSRPRQKSAYWFRFTSEAKPSARYGR
jgi:hypothetical protein